MTDHELAIILSSLLIVTAFIGTLEPPCREPCCIQRRTIENADRQRRQAELQHDTEHKGFGWRDGDEDRFNCHDDNCRRNPHDNRP